MTPTTETVVLARLTMPVTTMAVSEVFACYHDECHRLGYSQPVITGVGHAHYQPGFITIVTDMPQPTL